MNDNAKRTTLTRALSLMVFATFAAVAGALVGNGAAGEAEATGCTETYDGVVEWGGIWAQRWTDCNGSTRHWEIVDAHGIPVPIDVPKPDYETQFNDDGSMTLRAVYEGDLVHSVYCVTTGGVLTTAGCGSNKPGELHPQPTGGYVPTWLRTELRPNTSGAAPPLANQPGTLQYQADANHRVVLGEDGQYYREWRVNGRWLRSTPYGTDDDALQRARLRADDISWIHRVLRSSLQQSSPPPVNSGSTQGSPPLSCEEQFADLPPSQRVLICSGM